MQTHDSKSVPSLATPINALLSNASAVVAAQQKKAERLAKLLSAAMQEIHGGEWRIQINHEAGAEFAMVVQKPIRNLPRPMEAA